MRMKLGIGMTLLLALAAGACNKSDPTDPSVPASLVTLDGAPQTGGTGDVAVAPLRVMVKNLAGDGVGGVIINWAVTEGGGSVAAATSTTSSGGIAAMTFTYGDAGRQVITATIPGLAGSPQTFVLTSTGGGGGDGGGGNN